MHIRDLMIPLIDTLKPDLPIAAATSRMRRSGSNAVPVCSRGKLLGLITRNHIEELGSRLSATTDIRVRDVMIADPVWCCDTETVDDAAGLIESRSIAYLPVLDEQARVIGIVEKQDLISAAKTGV